MNNKTMDHTVNSRWRRYIPRACVALVLLFVFGIAHAYISCKACQPILNSLCTLASQQWLTLVLICGGLFLWFLWFIIIRVPKHQVRSLLPAQMERFERENEARKTVGQIVGGVLVVFSLCLGAWQLKLTKEGQITDRFIKAIDELGATEKDGVPAMERRLGGIYALDRIARESGTDHWYIMELLTAYVRQDAPSVPVRSNNKSPDRVYTSPRIDIQAVLTMIALRPLPVISVERSQGHLLNLKGTNLQGANLINAHLQAVDLTDSQLQRVQLNGAQLQGAWFKGAQMDGADLSGAHLQGADLSEARGLRQDQLDHVYFDRNSIGPPGLEFTKTQENQLNEEDNLAALSKGAQAFANSSAGERYQISHLNDGTQKAWGAAEDDENDAWAAVSLREPHAIHEFRISLFSPERRLHLKDIRVVTADSVEASGPMLVVRSRLLPHQRFCDKVTVPNGLDDGSYVTILIDHKDPNWGAHRVWGIRVCAKCGDDRNYLPTGTGVYVRELQMK